MSKAEAMPSLYLEASVHVQAEVERMDWKKQDVWGE